MEEFEKIYRKMAVTLYNDRFVKDGAQNLEFDDNGNVIEGPLK